MTTDLYLNSLTRLDTQQSTNAQQTSSGQNIQQGSDDSLLYSNLLTAQNKLTNYNSIKKGFDNVEYYHESLQDGFENIKNTYDAISATILESRDNFSATGDNSSQIATLEGLRDKLFGILDEKVNGKYIFSGSSNNASLSKDDNYAINGVIKFDTSTKLKTILTAPNSYQEIGALTNEGFYTPATEITVIGEALAFGDTDESTRFAGEDGNEWVVKNIHITGVSEVVLTKVGVSGFSHFFSLSSEETQANGEVKYVFDLTQLRENRAAGIPLVEIDTPVIKINSVFDDLNVLINTLAGKRVSLNGEIAVDTTGNEIQITDSAGSIILGEVLDKFNNDYTPTIISSKASFMGRAQNLEDGKEILDVKINHLVELKSRLGDADIAQLAVEATQLKLAYQSIYAAISRMSGLSLVNFLK